jgi:hypothetical protein
MWARFETRGESQLLKRLQRAHHRVEPILKRWIGAIKAESRRAFDGLQELAESTRARYEQTRTDRITVFGKVRADYARRLRVAFRDRPPEARQELERILGGGSPDYSLDTTGSKALERLRNKIRRHQVRRAKAEAKGKGLFKAVRGGSKKRRSAKHELLGLIRGANRGQIHSGAAVTVRNMVGFSGVQNRGGRVGNGAQLPPRTFLEIVAKVVGRMKRIFIDEALRS